MQYDGNGQMTGVTDWLGNTTQFQYDTREAGRPKVDDSVVRPTPSVTDRYDVGVRNAAEPDPPHHGSGRVRKPARDARLHPRERRPDHQRPLDWARRPGPLVFLWHPGKAWFVRRLSGHLRLTEQRHAPPDGSTLSYDAGDQLTSMQCGQPPATFSYDADGRRTGSSTAASWLSYGWNAAGDLTSFTANGSTTTYTINGDGQRVSSFGGGVTHSFVWDTAQPAKGIIVIAGPPAAPRVRARR